MWSMSPPRASVIALVGVPAPAALPPQGASFCGSPLSSWTSEFAGASRTKSAVVADGASKATAPMAKATEALILEILQLVFGCSRPITLSLHKHRMKACDKTTTCHDRVG